jgi:5'(3')-deoxyribonucleotidase
LKPVIAIDMDDTIYRLVERAVYHHNIRYPDHIIEKEQLNSWICDGIWHPECNEEIFFRRPGLFEELELFDEFVINQMAALHRDYTVWIVTAAHPTSVLEKWNSLMKYFPYIDYANFFPVKQKHLLPFDLLIDDGPHNIIPAIQQGKRVIGIEQPWNKEIRQHAFFVNGWKDMKHYVDEAMKDKWKEIYI